MKGKAVYIKAEFANYERKRAGVRIDEPHLLDSHFGLHVVIGAYDNQLEIAPVIGQEMPITVPAHAVWVLGAN